MPNVLLVAAAAALLHHAPAPDARAILDTAVARMGGIAALRSVERMKVESITEWQRTALDGRPNPYVLSYEWSTELRDYARPGWRYTRRFIGANGWQEIVDLVTDSVAAIKVAGKWQAQNVAYLAERAEMFTFTPERLMLLASDAPDAAALADTTIGTLRYTRVRATVGGVRVTLHFGKRHGGLALASFRHAQPKDFGLAPWGEMDVAIWYSRWQRLAPTSPLTVPTQLDIYRVGKPYKRLTTIAAVINPAIPDDSLVVNDTLRAAFLANGAKAMFDLPMDTAKIVADNFAVFGTPGTPSGAIKLGGKWLLIEGGTGPISAERSASFLATADARTPLAGAIVTMPTASAGITWLLGKQHPVWATESARPYAEASLRGWGNAQRVTPVATGSWLRIGSDSLLVDSLDLPDFPALAVLYAPSLKWAYIANPAAADRVAALARQRGWSLERIGSSRTFAGVPLPK